MQYVQEFIAVFSPVDILHAGAKDRFAVVVDGLCQIDRGLPAKLYDHALRLFLIDNIEHAFLGKRLEIKLIGRIKVRGYRFRIGVDDDRFIAELLERIDRMHGAVIKFNPLTNPDRPGTKYNNLLFIRKLHLVLVVVGGIVIRRNRLELARAGVYLLERRPDAERVTHIRDL